jgi:HSP20 family protein
MKWRNDMLKKGTLSIAKREPESDLSPFEGFEKRFGDLERRFEEFFRRPFSMLEIPWHTMWAGIPGAYSPSVDVYEEGGDIVVKAEIPGMKKEEIHVEVGKDSVTISGEKKKEEKAERKNYYRLERSYGSFTRTCALPADVVTDKARATFRNGVLEVRLPKSEEAKKKGRTVSIE